MFIHMPAPLVTEKQVIAIDSTCKKFEMRKSYDRPFIQGTKQRMNFINQCDVNLYFYGESHVTI